MSSGEDRQSPHEIVLVRRRGGGHGDGHHGGAWKIAFADFMTALMCFFLVMWLINASDKETLVQVATYFNPIRLNDRVPTQKGIKEEKPQQAAPEPADKSNPSEKKEQKKEKQKAKAKPAEKSGAKVDANTKEAKSEKAKKPKPEQSDKSAQSSEATEMEIFRDPHGVLQRIANAQPQATERDRPPDSLVNAPTSRDPFDAFPVGQQGAADGKPAGQPAAAPPGSPASQTTTGPQGAHAKQPGHPGQPGESAHSEKPKEQASDGQDKTDAAAGKNIAEAVSASLSDLKPGKRPNVEVAETEKEIMISITDEFDFGMFAVGSAQPTPELLSVMERIAKVLAGMPGKISIRGHTDGRQYRGGGYDNWRLSMSRAQIAYQMLARGGLQESRVQRIQGDADRSLKVSTDPLAASNRRIEILIGKDQE